MKKIFYIGFTVIFTVLTVGVSAGMHYSGGELYSFSLYGEADSCCEVPCDCCSEETINLQFNAEYVLTVVEHIYAKESLTGIQLDLIDELHVPESFEKHISFLIYTDMSPPGGSHSLARLQTFRL